jgi:hypothetical protein
MIPSVSRRRLAVLAVLAAALLAALWLALGRRRGSPVSRPPADEAASAEPVPGAAARPLPIRLPAGFAARSRETTPGAFEGRVISAVTAEGIAGAELTFSRAGAASSTRSGPGGAFRFEPPASGRWRLAAVTADGYLPFAPEWEQSPVLLVARPGEVLRDITISLSPAPRYRGLVLSPDGGPVPGAEVRLLGGATGETALFPLADRFTADARGEFAFAAREGAVLEARHPAFSPGRAELDRAACVAGKLVLRLRPRAGEPAAPEAISGRVLDPDGNPVEGALLEATFLWAPRREESLHADAQAVSDGAGRFALRGLDPGFYLVAASREGFAPARRGRVRTGTSDLELRLSPGGRLEGTVRDRRTGRPVAPFTVVVRLRRGPLRLVPAASVAVIDPAGRYALSSLPPGPAVVNVVSPSHAPSADVDVTIPAPPAGPAIADFDLLPGGRLTGRITERGSGRPLPGASVVIEGALESPTVLPLHSEALTGPDGRFTLDGLPAQPFSLFASAPGHHARVLSGLAIPEGGERGPVSVELTPAAEGEEPRVELAGIGVVLQIAGDGLRVARVAPGGGAAEVGIAAGDEILFVDGRPVAEVGFKGAIDMIRGPEGSTVILGMRRAGEGPVVPVPVPRRLVRG